MTAIPCPLCGYDAPDATCPHCRLAPTERTLARRPRSGLGRVLVGILDGLQAVPRGLLTLLHTRGTKRWLIPPMLLTGIVFFGSAWWLYVLIGEAVEAAVPDEVDLSARWEWLESLPERWDWLKSTWAAIAAALQWIVDQALAFLPGSFTRTVLWILITVLAGWYLFSIAYEALAGPFLDEIQGRIEERWFGHDPRKDIGRPTDLSPEHCAKRSWQWSGAALLALAAGTFLTSFWLALLLVPIVAGIAVRVEPEYGKWLGWVARIEGRALWVGIQASIVTGLLMLVALPVYFVLPPVGPVLFAGVVGFATSVSLLDIPFERRDWSLRDRLRFVGRNLPAMIAFGSVSGFLLAVPIVGWALMVPAASVGGLWLVCRLDKDGLRPAGRRWGRG